MKKLLLILIMIIIFSTPFKVHSTNGMKLIGVSPIQKSMGGANVGLPLDSGAAITNPAGISKLKKRVDVAVGVFSPSVEYKATSSVGQVTNNGRIIQSDTQPSFLPGIGGVLPINDKFKVRGGYNYGKNPLDSDRPFEVIAFPGIAEHHITAGLGAKVKENWELNLGLMYAPEVSQDAGNLAVQFIDNATVYMHQFSADVGLTYHFN